jgi:hypothetical protein
MNTVYLLWHTRKWEEGEDPELLIGVYRTEADATDAIERFRLQPGFAEYPEGFLVVAYELGKDHWTKDLPECLETRTFLPRRDNSESCTTFMAPTIRGHSIW